MNREDPNENELVAMTLFEFLKDNGVDCWWENETYEMSLISNINPYFYIGNMLDDITTEQFIHLPRRDADDGGFDVRMVGGNGKFKVRYVGRTGEVIVTDLTVFDRRTTPLKFCEFSLCDPECFEQVLEFVR